MQDRLARALRMESCFPQKAVSVTAGTDSWPQGVLYINTPGRRRSSDVCDEAAGTLHRGSCVSGCRCWGGIEYNSPLWLGVGSILHEPPLWRTNPKGTSNWKAGSRGVVIRLGTQRTASLPCCSDSWLVRGADEAWRGVGVLGVRAKGSAVERSSQGSDKFLQLSHGRAFPKHSRCFRV